MTRFVSIIGISLVCIAGQSFQAAGQEDPSPTDAEKSALKSLPEGFIVYGTGEKSGDDGKAYGIYKIDMQETTPVKIAELGRAPMIHPSNPSRIVYSEPVAPGSNQYNIVVIDFEGDNRQVITKSPMPNIMFVSWTDRGELVFTSSDQLPVYNDPLKMYHMDLEGTVTHIPTSAAFTTSGDERGGGIDGVFMFQNRVLLRHDYKVGMYEIDQENVSAGLTRRIKIAGNWTCGVTPYPDWSGFLFNGTNHGVFIEKKTDDAMTEVTVHDAPRGWANDFAWSNEYEWAVFTLEKTDDCSEDVYVYNLDKRQVTRHTWVDCKTFPHNPDIWVGPYELSRVAKPVIIADPYLVGDSMEAPVTCRTEGATIHYTIDNTTPTQQSPRYTEPVIIRADSTTLTVRAFKDGLDPSRITTLTFYKGLLRKPENPSKTLPGFTFAYYENCTANGGFDSLTPTATGVLDSVSLAIPDRTEDNFVVVFHGFLSIPESGLISFALNSDDGSRLFVGDSLVVDNWGPHGPMKKWGTILLQSGLHAARVEYSELGGGQVCELSYKGSGFPEKIVPASACFHEDPNADPVIIIVSPVEKQSFSLGSKLTVSWNYSEGSDVVVELSTDDGLNFSQLSRVLTAPGTTQFEWTIPNDAKYITDNARIHLFDYNKIMVETVSPAFRISSSVSSHLKQMKPAINKSIILANGKLFFSIPVAHQTTPRINVLSTQGRIMHLPVHNRGAHSFFCDLSVLDTGAFFITMCCQGRSFTKKYINLR